MLDSIREFLDQPLLVYLSTIDLSGFPHTVPVWFGVDGDELILPTMADRVRLKHIAANPNGAVAIGGNLSEAEGHLIKGCTPHRGGRPGATARSDPPLHVR